MWSVPTHSLASASEYPSCVEKTYTYVVDADLPLIYSEIVHILCFGMRSNLI